MGMLQQQPYNKPSPMSNVLNATGGDITRVDVLKGKILELLPELLQQLAENDPNMYGAPPASKSSIEALPTICIFKEHLGKAAMYCAVCKDEFELHTEVKQMSCKHLYHFDCVLPWLAQCNSCPMCQCELPVDELDHEQGCSQGFRTGSSSNTTGPRGRQGVGPGGFSIQDILSRQATKKIASVTCRASAGNGGARGCDDKWNVWVPQLEVRQYINFVTIVRASNLIVPADNASAGNGGARGCDDKWNVWVPQLEVRQYINFVTIVRASNLIVPADNASGCYDSNKGWNGKT
ncbi:hypothetical protein L7F22_033111 [Adiantum nelumboides]|nr:hypothetical protein [Adiantum nelumboides]